MSDKAPVFLEKKRMTKMKMETPSITHLGFREEDEPLTGHKRPRNNEVRTQKKKIAGTQESQIGYVEAFLYKSFPKGWLVANTSYVMQSLIESSTTWNLRSRSKLRFWDVCDGVTCCDSTKMAWKRWCPKWVSGFEYSIVWGEARRPRLCFWTYVGT